jgi:predicted small secreted protein
LSCIMNAQSCTAAAVLIFAAGPIVSACPTVHGVGEDLSAAGKAISHTAEKASGNKWRQRPDTRNRNGPMSCISLPMNPSAVDASALGRRAAAISMMLP